MKTVNRKLILSLCLLSGVGLMFEAGTAAAAISARASRTGGGVNINSVYPNCQKVIGMYQAFPNAKQDALLKVESFQAKGPVPQVRLLCNAWYNACKNNITKFNCMTANHNRAVLPWNAS